ncbi:hypothetical protein RND71_012210 [Anisodus tanguticus]|uniref:Protein kinase domain-containing protein n=1 Tax=Anisodus tanguticus TaxID=243964 RepID=A0AAE1SFF0_9SOLA|nr:hypothetical protein RND71_012210 [Anisodus tanguticus]
MGGTTTFSADPISNSRHSLSVNQPGSSGIYATARVFNQTSLYSLSIHENGVYMVRLHFFPFSNLFDAKFDVLASGFLILSNYSVPKNVIFPVIKEFLLPVNGSYLNIQFRPSQESFVFVNAIEAFVTPQKFIPNSATHVIPQGSGNNGKKDLSLSGLSVIHRINVGGRKITAENDTMGRNWVPDDDYLFIKQTAKNAPMYSNRPSYDPEGGATEYDAPDFVYKTAKEMNTDVETQSNKFFNITWHFGVNRDASFFVRLHFCDIVSGRRNDTVFNVYIYGLFGQPIQQSPPKLATPFFFDFVVDSDGSGLMNISVGPRDDLSSKNAFLNGVEIMELINERGEEKGNGQNKNLSLIIVGSVVGGVVLVFVFIVVILVCLKSRKAKPVESVDGPMVNVYAGSTQTRTTIRTPIGSTTPDMNLGLKKPLTEILYATKKFDPKFMIGEGGFGKVYKGTLHNGDKVAVKRSQPGQQGILEFQTEITLLSKIRHQHLVSLIGYCDEQDEMILVYEFMEKGTLREHLYSSNEDLGKSSSQSELSWDQRLQICIGAAKGLHYLHTGLSPIDETHIVTDVKGKINPNSLRKFGETAEKCLQDDGIARPNMVDVLWDLKYALQLQNPANPQEFHEDSATDVSWQLALPGINRLPSINVSTSFLSGSESEVFSQLRIDKAR